MHRCRILLGVPLLVGVLAGCAGSTGSIDDDVVRMLGMAFVSNTTEVPVGTEVVWTNDSGMWHTVTSTDGGPLDSGEVDPGEVFRFTFDDPGTYWYRCVPHSIQNQDGTWRGMVGVVHVTPA